ncbi:MAG TPA: ABC transporter substrate-binding protein [Methylomirabilota bacterium]|nr:ABC transporter substrate-binding protein [Methylomirabilota bacterium]
MNSSISKRDHTRILVWFLFAVTGFLGLSDAAAHAQTGKVYRIGFLREGRPPQSFVEALEQGLREQGYAPGQNVVIDFRTGSLDQLPALSEELVRLKVDVILASAGSAALAAKKATAATPIVFATVNYPVEIGLVPSLSRPGGNITGTSFNAAELAAKRLELLKELVPTLRRVAVLSYPPYHTNAIQLKEAEAAARTLGMQLEPIPVRNPNDFDAGFKAVRSANGLLQLDNPFFTTHRARITELTARSRLPAIYGYRQMVEAGGLMSYGPDVPDLHRRAATYVDKILKGAKPGDLPVEQPAKFELVINAKTAKHLGLTVPPSLLLRADRVIE